MYLYCLGWLNQKIDNIHVLWEMLCCIRFVWVCQILRFSISFTNKTLIYVHVLAILMLDCTWTNSIEKICSRSLKPIYSIKWELLRINLSPMHRRQFWELQVQGEILFWIENGIIMNVVIQMQTVGVGYTSKGVQKNSRYCGIIWIRGGSIVVVFMGNPPSQIYILDKNKTSKSFLTDASTKITMNINYMN